MVWVLADPTATNSRKNNTAFIDQLYYSLKRYDSKANTLSTDDSQILLTSAVLELVLPHQKRTPYVGFRFNSLTFDMNCK